MNSRPYMGHFYFLFFDFQLGLSPSFRLPAVPRFPSRFVNENLHKNVGNPIENADLIRYIYSRNKGEE